MARYFIDSGADLSIYNVLGKSALTLATERNQMPVVQGIISSRKFRSEVTELLDHQDYSGKSSLMIASSEGHIEIMELLLKAGASVNISNFSDYSSLHLLPEKIKLPVDASHINSMKGSALDIAVLQGTTEIVTLLLQYDAKVHNIFYLFRGIILKQAQENNRNPTDNLMQMIKSTRNFDPYWEKYYIIFQLLFSHDRDLINRLQCTKPSTLYMACAFGVVEMVSLLLELEIDVSDLYRIDDMECHTGPV